MSASQDRPMDRSMRRLFRTGKSMRRPSRNCQRIIWAQAPSRPEGRAYARAERSAAPCTVPSTDAPSSARWPFRSPESRVRELRADRISTREDVSFAQQHFQETRDRNGQQECGLQSWHSLPQRCRASCRLTHRLRHMLRQRQPWRERPLRTRAGPFAARPAGSLTPCLLL